MVRESGELSLVEGVEGVRLVQVENSADYIGYKILFFDDSNENLPDWEKIYCRDS